MQTFRKFVLGISTATLLLAGSLASFAAQAQTAQTQDIQRLHVGLFGRPADFDALAFYIGQPLNLVATSTGTAFASRNVGLSAPQIVDKVFTNLFGHVASAPDNSFLSAQLTSGALNNGTLVLFIINNVTGADLNVVTLKLLAATLFTQALDTAAEIMAYSSAAPFAVGAAFIASITDNASFSAATTPANLDAVIAQVVIAAQPPVTFVSAKSLKAHGNLPGLFEIPLDITKLIGGAVSVEPRIGFNGHLIVFTFSGAINNAGTVQVIPVGTATALKNGSTVEVRLAGIPDNQRVTVSLAGVNGSVNAAVSLGFLVGDVGDTRAVSAADIAALRARSGSAVDVGNARYDLTASGTINDASVTAARARAGLRLP
ncbi:MAG: hypothetical protein ABI905_12140 [Betaproteobacteria bacterium]